MQDTEEKALRYLSTNICEMIRSVMNVNNGLLMGISLRCNFSLALIVNGENIICDYFVTRDDIRFTTDKLCKSSLYAHADEIRNGIITTDCGIRAGVCGTAVTKDNKITNVHGITSISIRIPHRIVGAAEHIIPIVDKYRSILVYSRPAGGKTTVLRELIPYIARKHRTAVIDTRYELSYFDGDKLMCDVFMGYPRYDGIMSAVRTMSPEYIICDEISTREEAEAVLYAHAAGVNVVTTAHAGDITELYKNHAVAMLVNEGVFDCLCGLRRFGEEPEIKVCI